MAQWPSTREWEIREAKPEPALPGRAATWANLQARPVDPRIPGESVPGAQVSLERRKNFFDEDYVTSGHLGGTGVVVGSEVEPNLMCTMSSHYGLGYADIVTGPRRPCPNTNILKGSGVNEFVDHEPRDPDRIRRDRSYRKPTMGPTNNLLGARIDIRPDGSHKKGKNVGPNPQKAGKEGMWWEHHDEHSYWAPSVLSEQATTAGSPLAAGLGFVGFRYDPEADTQAGVRYDSDLDDMDDDIVVGQDSHTPPRSVTPRSEMPRSETPYSRRLAVAQVTPRSETPGRGYRSSADSDASYFDIYAGGDGGTGTTPRCATPCSGTPRSGNAGGYRGARVPQSATTPYSETSRSETPRSRRTPGRGDQCWSTPRSSGGSGY